MRDYEPRKPLERAKERAERRRARAVKASLEGASPKAIAKELGVHPMTVYSDLAKPASQAELQVLRDEFRAFVLKRTSTNLMQSAVDLAEGAAKDGDPKGFELATRAAVNLDKLTASAVGETQRVDVTGHVNVDVRALIAQMLSADAAQRPSS